MPVKGFSTALKVNVYLPGSPLPWVKVLPATSASHMVPCWSPGSLYFSPQSWGKAADDGLRVWVPAAYVGDSDETPVSILEQLKPLPKTHR